MATTPYDMRTAVGRAAVLQAIGAPVLPDEPRPNYGPLVDTMQIITVNVPRRWVAVLDAMKSSYLSRSEAIRTAIRDFFLREMSLAAALEEATQ